MDRNISEIGKIMKCMDMVRYTGLVKRSDIRESFKMEYSMDLALSTLSSKSMKDKRK